MLKLIPTVLLSLFLIPCNAQQWEQKSSTDIDGTFSEVIHEHNGYWYAESGGGIWRSSDGLNWTNSSNNLIEALGRLRIEGLTTAGTNLLGINRWDGIVISSNNGDSWASSSTGLPQSVYNFSKYTASIGNDVYISLEDNSDSKKHIYKSTDGGLSWNQYSETMGIADLIAIGDTILLSYEDTISSITTDGINYSFPDFGLNFNGEAKSIFQSGDYLFGVDGGNILRYNLITNTGNWENINNTIGTSFFASIYGGDNLLFASALGFNGTKFYRSSDFGDSWTEVPITLPTGIPFAMAAHVSNNELLVNFIDAGMYYSNNSGQTISEANSGLNGWEFEHFFANDNTLLGGTFVSGVLKSTDDGLSWSTSNSGLPSEALTHVYNFKEIDGVIYANLATQPQGNPAPDRVVYSENDGVSWSLLNMPESISKFKLLGFHGSSLIGYSDDPTDAYFISSDAGATWSDITSNLPSTHDANTFSGDGSTLYMVGENQGDLMLFSSNDNGGSWIVDTVGLSIEKSRRLEDNDPYEGILTDANASFFAFEIDHTETIFRKQGNTWVKIAAQGVPYFDLESWAFHNGSLYVGLWRSGIFKSDDLGDTFEDLSAGLPEGLSLQSFGFSNGKIFAASNGAGVWEYDPTITSVFNDIELSSIIYPNPSKGLINFNTSVDHASIFDINGRFIRSEKVENSQLKLENLDKGLYLIGFKTSNGLQFEKIILE